MGKAVERNRGGRGEMFLLDRAIRRFVAEDDVHLVGPAALVGAEHDGVRGVTVQPGGVVGAVTGGEELEVRASAFQAVLEGNLVLEGEPAGGIEGCGEGRGVAVVAGSLGDVEAVVLGAVRLDDGGDAGVLLVARGGPGAEIAGREGLQEGGGAGDRHGGEGVDAGVRGRGAGEQRSERHRAGRDGDQLHDRVRAGVCGDVPRAYEVKVIARRSE